MEQFKIHCHAIGEIMGGVNRPTPKQLAELARLQEKAKTKPLTANQQETVNDIIKRRDAKPELQKGAKTYCQKWLKERLYKRRKEFSNKYTEKGNLCEPEGIELTARIMGYGLISKNEKFFSDADICGTPDLILPDIVEDIKNSWDCFTFPLFATELPDSDYYYQLQGYMALTGLKKASVNYCLIDAPEELIDREARSVSYKAGFNEVEMELYDEVAQKMKYTDIPDRLRFKRFEFERDDNVIAQIREQVKLCREYIASINPINSVLLATPQQDGVILVEPA